MYAIYLILFQSIVNVISFDIKKNVKKYKNESYNIRSIKRRQVKNNDR